MIRSIRFHAWIEADMVEEGARREAEMFGLRDVLAIRGRYRDRSRGDFDKLCGTI